MANFSISLTVPDDKVTELVEALCWHWGQKSPGVEYTTAELRAKLKASVEDSLKGIFLRHKEHLRNSQAVSGNIAIT